MQLYAFDQSEKIIFAREARRQKNYICPECRRVVRLRGGIHRQNHFYHLEASSDCRQSSKSIEHINVQLFFLRSLPTNDCLLEQRFPNISRIADVVWTSKKIIFEIQCSPISRQEVMERSLDYERLGFRIVWILHDQRFNQKRLSGAEEFLHFRVHYFTNINSDGEVIIYDQFSLLEKGFRKECLKPLPIDVTHLKLITFEEKISLLDMLEMVKRRLVMNPFYFSNDLVDYSLNHSKNDYITQALQVEMNSGLLKAPKTIFGCFKTIFFRYIVRPYRLLFQLLLERACK